MWAVNLCNYIQQYCLL
jgi:hypothetical protein